MLDRRGTKKLLVSIIMGYKIVAENIDSGEHRQRLTIIVHGNGRKKKAMMKTTF